MKQSRLKQSSFAAVLNPLAGLKRLAVLGQLAGIAVSLVLAHPAGGVVIPFTGHVIATQVGLTGLGTVRNPTCVAISPQASLYVGNKIECYAVFGSTEGSRPDS